MKTIWIPTKNIVVKWYNTVKQRLFPEHFHDLFAPTRMLAPLEKSRELEAIRDRYRPDVDLLIDSVLACSTNEEIESKLSSADPMLVALYYDRVIFVTYFLDNMIPVAENPPCEIPQNWSTFVSLLLHQKWFV